MSYKTVLFNKKCTYFDNYIGLPFLARLFSKKRRGIVIALVSSSAAATEASCEKFDIF